MYVLLNLKDGSRLSEVVQLLFAHGHTAVSVAEKVEDLCPHCERLARQTATSPEQPQRNSPTPTTSYTPEIRSQDVAVSSKETDLMLDGRLVNSDTPSEEVEEAVPEQHFQRQEIDSVTPPHPIAEVKEESAENEDKVPKSEVTGKAEQFSVTSALELLCNAGPSVTAHDDLDLDVTAAERTGTPRPSKRIARIEKLGLETFTCQLCKKSITRQGQYANLVNHLSRHARLHASKKQYCCPVCRASFSRRYLAYAHVREAHTKHGYVEPVDHGRELREEYRSLLEVCFPGASTRRKTASNMSTANKGNRTDKKGKGTARTAPAYKDELSRLLE